MDNVSKKQSLVKYEKEVKVEFDHGNRTVLAKKDVEQVETHDDSEDGSSSSHERSDIETGPKMSPGDSFVSPNQGGNDEHQKRSSLRVNAHDNTETYQATDTEETENIRSIRHHPALVSRRRTHMTTYVIYFHLIMNIHSFVHSVPTGPIRPRGNSTKSRCTNTTAPCSFLHATFQ